MKIYTPFVEIENYRNSEPSNEIIEVTEYEVIHNEESNYIGDQQASSDNDNKKLTLKIILLLLIITVLYFLIKNLKPKT